jgi:hypothetical protein
MLDPNTPDRTHPAYARLREAALAVGRSDESRIVDCSDVYRVRGPNEKEMPQGWTHELRNLAILVCEEAMIDTGHVWLIRAQVQAAALKTRVEICRMGPCG